MIQLTLIHSTGSETCRNHEDITMRLMPYKLGSKSAKTLSAAMNIKRVKPDGNFRNNYNHLLLNWGCSQTPEFPTPRGIINQPQAVAKAVNKLTSLNILRDAGVPTLTFHTTAADALSASMEGKVLYARKYLTSNSGRGITVIQPNDEIPYAPLFTEFFDKTVEYRVHATRNGVFDFQAKLKRRGSEADPYVFNYSSGRVFCRQGIELPDAVATASVDAINALGLDFGAVDIGVDADGNVAVFEINTACALEGSTITSYKDALEELKN